MDVIRLRLPNEVLIVKAGHRNGFVQTGWAEIDYNTGTPCEIARFAPFDVHSYAIEQVLAGCSTSEAQRNAIRKFPDCVVSVYWER